MNLNLQTRNSLLWKLLVKWVWSNSRCFSHASDGGECFIHPATHRIHADLLKLIKNPSPGCQIWAAVFLCSLLYQIKNLWQSEILPNFKWSVWSKFNKLYHSVSFRVIPVSGSARAGGEMGTELLPLNPCLLSSSLQQHPTPPKHLQCFQPQENIDQCVMGVLCCAQAGKRGTPKS